MRNVEYITHVMMLPVAGVMLLVTSSQCFSSEDPKDGDDALRAAVQNPISSLVSLPFKFNFDYGAANGDRTTLNIQPVYPITTGVSAVALNQRGWGNMGILGRQLWSFAGDSNRSDVNQLLIEPFANYNLANGCYLVSDIIITANWEAPSSQTWTVPLSGGVGRIHKIGTRRLITVLNFITT